MINRSIGLNDFVEGGHNKPFFLNPIGKDYLWGGTRLQDDFAKNIGVEPLEETWECSAHPDGISQVASGEYKGWNLQEVLRENPSFLGAHSKMEEGFPILIKFIDAKDKLSVQVHPDDEYARLNENGQKVRLERT